MGGDRSDPSKEVNAVREVHNPHHSPDIPDRHSFLFLLFLFFFFHVSEAAAVWGAGGDVLLLSSVVVGDTDSWKSSSFRLLLTD